MDDFHQAGAYPVSRDMDILMDYFCLPCIIPFPLFEHARADRADLGTVVGTEDGGHQVSSKGRTRPCHVAAFLINIKARTVCRQSCP